MAASMRRQTCKARLKMATRRRISNHSINHRLHKISSPNTHRSSLMQIRRLSTYSQTTTSRPLPLRQ